MHIPKVSVVIPSYNHERYIVEAIESVRRQTMEDWELIVIDDGSTDQSWDVLTGFLASLGDSRIRLERQENAGSHATLNRGVAMSSAPYVAILNSDDRYSPNRLQRMLDEAQLAGKEAFVVSAVSLIDDEGHAFEPGYWWLKMYDDLRGKWLQFQAASVSGNPAVDALLWGNITISTSNFFFSRELWNKVGKFKPLRYVVDWEFALRVASLIEPSSFRLILNESLLDYRLHGRNTILGGALRNHAEARGMLNAFQKQWLRSGRQLPAIAIDRVYYLARFMRQEQARQLDARWRQEYQQLQLANEELRELLNESNQQLQAIFRSRSWRWTGALRRIARLLRRGAVKDILRRMLRPLRKAPAGYRSWLLAEKVWLRKLREQVPAFLASADSRPSFSIIMPVHNPEPKHLQQAIESVRAQWYADWQLCICDDASSRPEVSGLLEHYKNSDARISVCRRDQAGHISVASNAALELANGDYVIFLDHDDLLAEHALFSFARAICQSPRAEVLYADEDKIDERGNRMLPLFKPAFSPALLWSQNYIGHPVCVEKQILLDMGGLAKGAEGAQDHDLMMRLRERGATFLHLPGVLYHWRLHPGSTSDNADAKPYAHEAGKKAVARHLHATYGDAFKHIEEGAYPFLYFPRFGLPEDLRISIIIPTRDRLELLQPCIDSIRAATRGVVYEIIVVDNGSTDASVLDYLARIHQSRDATVVRSDTPFNWSHLNNIGRACARGAVLVFLNNDTIIEQSDWLVRLAEYAMLPDVAVVGPMLFYSDHSIQHAGVVLGMGGWADHVFKGEKIAHHPSPFISSVTPRNVLALTGACHAIATERFDALGGFDERFEICGSDVELCLRAHRAGYQNIYLPTVRFLHLESKTRSPDVPENDFEQSARAYHPYRTEEGDPFFNPNLDLHAVAPGCAWPDGHVLQKVRIR